MGASGFALKVLGQGGALSIASSWYRLSLVVSRVAYSMPCVWTASQSAEVADGVFVVPWPMMFFLQTSYC
eukprot:9481631-Pyramimonas_sp.AAC.1